MELINDTRKPDRPQGKSFAFAQLAGGCVQRRDVQADQQSGGRMAHVRSRHSSRWEPLHAMLGAFPLAFFPAALVTDIAYAATAQMQWANFSTWMIAGGVVMGIAAALAGIVDAVIRSDKARQPRTALHSILTLAAFAVAILNGFIHSRDAWTSVVPTGLALSAVSAILILAAAWSGYSATTAE